MSSEGGFLERERRLGHGPLPPSPPAPTPPPHAPAPLRVSTGVAGGLGPFSPQVPGKIGYVDETDTSESDKEPPSTVGDECQASLVTIRMRPDEQGRFGFNVKGGRDQNSPVIVTRVAPNTSAEKCYPRLNEGDQVLLINGREISSLSHDEVVNVIRNSKDSQSGQLVLTVRPNAVYLGEDVEEPAFEYVPEASGDGQGPQLPLLSSSSSSTPLTRSMLLLSESLESGSLVRQFEGLFRRKPSLSMDESRKPQNLHKNRYRDISPYDSTRVVLKGCENGDYINANYVNMEIPASGIVNRYIASQGPLSNTCEDFWVMVWERGSPLVIMLTTVLERGRVKCHRYWPPLDESLVYRDLTVTCLKEEESASFATREFTLRSHTTREERAVTQLQYKAWPDHGVPEDPTEFLSFVTEVRRLKAGHVEPTVVHCSAGIGRTGVLILMDTAMCLVEANQPVFPLEIVAKMREQRAMMIQTPSQYKFVCEAVLKVYMEGIAKPLPEYET
ncbi:unnamed protein product [Darwinula stevensoni]|uniref:Tyrosine-protein phosphatase non-receptor type 4 n=1 Tax=Darwinula stevensoni TaxID=69355 RepID=A0A7R9FPH6_9CRUS|nr:unnamed protein product [Darwinula stevensoni]CAG0898036.1 unnamed protein product [Darwinula stevensoni]